MPCRLAVLLLFGAAPAVAQDAPRWRIDATLDAGAGTLVVATCSDRAQERVRFFAGLSDAPRYLRGATRDSGADLAREGGDLHARHWRAAECLRTRIDLRAAAGGERRGFGHVPGRYYLLDPRRWLWRPARRDPRSTLHLHLPPGWDASLPWRREADGTHFTLGADPADGPALTAFGHFREQAIERRGGRVRVALLPPWTARDLARVEPVVDALLEGIGRLPREDAQLLVLPLVGHREAAPWGQTTRGAAPAVQLFVGAEAAPEALVRDWTATHELVHLLHPHLGPRGRWLSEGLASYWQHVLRARAGVLGADDAWDKFAAGLQRGRDDRRADGLTLEAAARQLGRRRSYMRVYWSGAAFWLEADLALRARGASLDAVLRRYADCCLAQTDVLAPEDFMAALDRLAGADVFTTRHARFAASTIFPPTRIEDVPAPLRRAIMQSRGPAR